MWMLSQDITGLLLAVRMKYTFYRCLIKILPYITGCYYEYRETFRHGLTADSRLLIAMDCRRGSLIKLCGLMRIKFLWSAHFCWPDTTWEQHCRPPTSSATPLLPPSSTWTGKMLSEQSIKTNKVASDVTIEACVVKSFACWMARHCPVAYWSPTGHLFRAFQAVSIEWPSLR